MTFLRGLLPLLAMVLALPPAVAAERPVLVELFTSEGCSSCPPADDFLAELAQRPTVLALAFHVDYWDRLGWKDRFSSPAATARQRDYAERLGLATVYTPQMVIDGRHDVIGSRRGEVEAALKAADTASAVPVTLALAQGQVHVAIGAAAKPAAATVWLIGFDRRHVTTIGGGENGGRTLTEADAVRSLAAIGAYRGAAATLTAPAPTPAERVAAIVQAADGSVLGLAVADLPPGS